jgi:hypothetical protein
MYFFTLFSHFFLIFFSYSDNIVNNITTQLLALAVKLNETKLTRKLPKGTSAGEFELFLHSLSSQALCVCRWATSHVAHLQQHFSTVEESGGIFVFSKFAENIQWTIES